MQQKRAGPFFSLGGCLSAAALVLIMGMFIFFRGGSLFSPGSLSAVEQERQPLPAASNDSATELVSHADFEEECGRCHLPWRGISEERCQQCHRDVAEERLAGAGLHGRMPNSGSCTECHGEHEGQTSSIINYELSTFEHDILTDFTLVIHQENFDGSSMDCGSCHPDGHYWSWQVTCQECHQKAEPFFIENHSLFFGDDCSACHDGQRLIVDFDHDMIFTLDGGHIGIECAACHLQPILLGTPGACSDCHEEPDIHLGQFGVDCTRCHQTTAWTPASLRYHTFPLDHGRETQSECSTCHQSNYQSYSCYGCHEHDQEQVSAEHLEEEIFEFEDCIDCHPTGTDQDSTES